MAEKELDLLQFASIYVTELCAGPAKIMGCEMIKH